MRAWSVVHQGPVSSSTPLVLGTRDDPKPGPRDVVIAVDVCGVCRTDLHVVEGDLPLRKQSVVPGHEIVGRVVERGVDAKRFAVGDRIGIAWLRSTCGSCRWCRRGQENLCRTPRFTGWDDDGGYAEYAAVDEAYAYALPDAIDDEHAAPLLCAGIIGYRALSLVNLPPDGVLGIYGFGASAHLAMQVALHRGVTCHVFTRAAAARELALRLGATSARPSDERSPEPLDGALLFAPAGELVPVALRALAPGGVLAIAGIHLTDIPAMSYAEHLFDERVVRSVTANTRADGEEFLQLAAQMDVRVSTQPYEFDQADRALVDLAADRVDGAAVVRIGMSPRDGRRRVHVPGQ